MKPSSHRPASLGRRSPLRHLAQALLASLLGFSIAAPFATPRLEKGRRPRTSKVVAAPKLERLLISDCHDGDTCSVRTPLGTRRSLRLAGIDAPEVAFHKKKGQAFGAEARTRLNDLVKGKTCVVENLGFDVYGRQLSLIYLNEELAKAGAGSSINLQLAREGYAFAYRGAKSERRLRLIAEDAEQSAKENSKGLWALEAQARPEEPRLWRALK